MNRRAFLRTTTALSALGALSGVPGIAPVARGQQREFAPRPGAWRSWELTTRVEIVEPRGLTQVWLPIPSVEGDYQRVGESRWSGNALAVRTLTEPRYGARMLYAEFAEAEKAPMVELVSRFRTQDRAVDWGRKNPRREDPATLKLWLEPTALMPTDGIVAETAAEITKGQRSDLDKVRAIYDWTVTNTYREPQVRGCGVGDIQAMLETRNLGGKCADINALFVGLARAAGVPARDVYGVRVGPSAFGYRSLGAGTPNVSKAQHCRAEVYLQEYGWVAMDPADVTKVAREETTERLPLEHPLVQAVRPALFGGWEGNWVAYNVAHDVALPHARLSDTLGFLMYPQAETAEGRRDSLDPETFKYTITARELRA